MSKIKYVAIEQDAHSMYVIVTKPVEEFSPDLFAKNDGGKFLADYSFVERVIKDLSGRFLTIADAVVSEKDQKKAVKDLMRQAIGDSYEFISKFMYEEEAMKKAEMSIPDEEIGEPVDLLEVIKN